MSESEGRGGRDGEFEGRASGDDRKEREKKKGLKISIGESYLNPSLAHRTRNTTPPPRAKSKARARLRDVLVMPDQTTLVPIA